MIHKAKVSGPVVALVRATVPRPVRGFAESNEYAAAAANAIDAAPKIQIRNQNEAATLRDTEFRALSSICPGRGRGVSCVIGEINCGDRAHERLRHTPTLDMARASTPPAQTANSVKSRSGREISLEFDAGRAA